MHNKMNINQHKSGLLDICALLFSLVRLMSCYVREPSTSQAMTLVQVLKQLQNHPDLAINPTVEIAIKNAQLIWQEELVH